jgi:hypothetical protein
MGHVGYLRLLVTDGSGVWIFGVFRRIVTRLARMALRKIQMVVFFGGDAATDPKNALLAWLRGPHVNLDARIVDDFPPSTSGSVDDRVDEAIRWADAAIALVTADKRSPHGAPNLMDEIGRWRGGNPKTALGIVRQNGVEPYSNHNGLVYVPFGQRVEEGFERLRRFIDSLLAPSGVPDSSADTAEVTAPVQVVVKEGQALVGGSPPRNLVFVEIQNHSGQPFHLAALQIAFPNGSVGHILRDALMNNPFVQKSIQSHDSLSVRLDPSDLKDKSGVEAISVVAIDKVDRRYESKAGELAGVLARLRA